LELAPKQTFTDIRLFDPNPFPRVRKTMLASQSPNGTISSFLVAVCTRRAVLPHCIDVSRSP
jgi:hypothetical protein